MKNISCRRCGCEALAADYISLGCPICGERIFLSEADDDAMWLEHRLGLMFRIGGWQWISEIEPPRWFLEHVV